MTIRPAPLTAFALVAVTLITSFPSARAATAAGAGIEVDGKYVGGYTTTRNGETGDFLVGQLSERPITFGRDFKIPTDAKDSNSATLKGEIRLLSRIRGNKQVVATATALELSRRDGNWFVEAESLERALKAAEKGEKAKQAAADQAAILIDMDAAKHKLREADTKLLADLVSKKPDEDTPDAINLDPMYRVILDGVDYALEPDSLILMHKGGTKIWRSPGLRKRVIPAAGAKPEKNRPKPPGEEKSDRSSISTPIRAVVKAKFESDHSMAKWDPVVAFDADAILEIGKGEGHGFTLARLRFQPRKDGVEVI